MTLFDNLEHITFKKKESRKIRLGASFAINLTNHNNLPDIIPHKGIFGELKLYNTGIELSILC